MEMKLDQAIYFLGCAEYERRELEIDLHSANERIELRVRENSALRATVTACETRISALQKKVDAAGVKKTNKRRAGVK